MSVDSFEPPKIIVGSLQLLETGRVGFRVSGNEGRELANFGN